MPTVNHAIFEGSTPIDESRHLRLCAAALDDDFAQVAAIAEEVATDARGAEIATWQLVMVGAVGMARQWALDTDVEMIRSAIQQALLEQATNSTNQ